eukprot:COSAG04_NODE_1773_length_5613_cov_2.489119_4_plen_315_part_01
MLIGVLLVIGIVVGAGMIALSFYVLQQASKSERSQATEHDYANGAHEAQKQATGDGVAATIENPLGDGISNATATASNSNAEGSAAALLPTSRRLSFTVVRTSIQPVKILISYWQLYAQLGEVLHFQFPPLMQQLMLAFKWLVAGLQGVVATECLHSGGYYYSWVLEVFVLPIVLFAGVLLHYQYRRKAVDSAVAAASLKSEAFFVLFIVYPSIVNKLFQIINCRDLGGGNSVLAGDYNTQCEGRSHFIFTAIAVVMIFVFAIGVPIGLMVQMARTRSEERALFSTPEWQVLIQRLATQLKQDDVDAVKEAVIDI